MSLPPRVRWPLNLGQSLAWNLCALRLWVRDLLGFDPHGGRSLDLYRRLVVLDR